MTLPPARVPRRAAAAVVRRDLRALIRASREARKGVNGLGPGLITGVADDDPSGISTYTITGATHGYSLLWTSIVTLPMNIAVQTLCARIGIVSGRGLAAVTADRFGRRALYPLVAMLLVANIVNIGADLGAIAAAIELLTGMPAPWLVLPLGVGIALTEVAIPYPALARVLKLLTLVIFAYVAGAFVSNPDWGAAARATVVPRLTLDREGVTAIVAILGTTISPYLFFWQASEEVEEEARSGISATSAARERIAALVRASHWDVATGMVMANLGFYFVVLTSAATLGASGRTDVRTAADAAEALRPLAGDGAALLFAAGIIGTGLLAIPVLAGSAGYAVAELFGWREGLSESLRRAPQFYAVIAASTLLGIGLTFTGISEMRALYLAAVVNGVTAPVVLVFIMLAAHDRGILGPFVPGPLLLGAGWVATAAMAVAAVRLLLA
ncbi:MAG: Nramp family divalent metal transporter [Thermoflexaceae bacterium]|nr:Nramp family divalent metal transporter [Thermoflexaceae bacterium]